MRDEILACERRDDHIGNSESRDREISGRIARQQIPGRNSVWTGNADWRYVIEETATLVIAQEEHAVFPRRTVHQGINQSGDEQSAGLHRRSRYLACKGVEVAWVLV